jgi:hypothetical protein
MVVPHIVLVENSFDAFPGQLHNQRVFCDIEVIIPVGKIILKRRRERDESDS